jgi:hypothetical protein
MDKTGNEVNALALFSPGKRNSKKEKRKNKTVSKVGPVR